MRAGNRPGASRAVARLGRWVRSPAGMAVAAATAILLIGPALVRFDPVPVRPLADPAPLKPYRLGYASYDSPHLAAVDPTSGDPVSLAGTNRPSDQASGRGRALIWSGTGGLSPTARKHGLWYLGPGSSTARMLTDGTAEDRHPSLSPDGSTVAFDSSRGGRFDIWLINVDGTGLRRLTDHPADDSWPTWAPDGRKIAFTSTRDDPAGDIYTVAVDGGAATRLTTDAAADTQPAWSPDGRKIAYTTTRWHGAGDIALIPAGGGTPTRAVPGNRDSSEPAWSPDGRQLAFVSRQGDPAGDVYVVPLSGSGAGKATAVAAHPARGDTHPTWYQVTEPDSGGSGRPPRLTARTRSLGPKASGSAGTPSPSPSAGQRTRTVVVYTWMDVYGSEVDTTDIWSADSRGGDRRDLTDRPVNAENAPAFSADGTRLAYAEYTGYQQGRIVVADGDGANPRALTEYSATSYDTDPTWSPDGTMIAFTRYPVSIINYAAGDGGTRDAAPAIATIFVVRVADGVILGQLPATSESDTGDAGPAWSPDGHQLAFSRRLSSGGGGSGDERIWLATLAFPQPDRMTVTGQVNITDRLGQPCVPNGRSGGYDITPAWSPDGRSLAFIADENTLCVVDTAGGHARTPVSGSANPRLEQGDPAWSPDGAVIAYTSSYSTPSGDNEESTINTVPAGGGIPTVVIDTHGGAYDPAFQRLPEPGLALTVAAAPQPGRVGGSAIQVTYTVRNSANWPVQGVWLSTTLPPALAPPAQVTGTGCDATGALCSFGTVPAGGTVTVTLTVPPRQAVTDLARGHLSGVAGVERVVAVDAQTPLVVQASPASTVTPVLRLNPGVGPPGFVTTATGTGFPVGATVRLKWSTGISKPVTVTAAGGAFQQQLLLLAHDQLGPRTLTAEWVAGPAFTSVTATFLVVPGSGQPSKFLVRR